MLRTSLAATVACFGFAIAAQAGEANSEPFPGPNAAIARHTGPNVHLTMGPGAPFNYFGKDKPMPLTNYHQAAATSADPFPFKMHGEIIRVQPAPRTSVASSPVATHG